MSNESLKIRVGHSPDPDDAFMFYALTTGALETPGGYMNMFWSILILSMKKLRREHMRFQQKYKFLS